MPRRRPDVVHEYRVSLSDFERAKISEVITTQQANVAVDGVTATLNAAGIALGGAGAVLAALVFMKWKGPTLWVDFTENVTNPIIDNIVDTILPGTPVEHRRYAQDLAARRGEIAKEEAAFCSLSASTYDQAKCSATFAKKDQYFADLEAFRKMVRETYSRVEREAIYYGLGDVNPEFVA
jgi:hypothetical protein